MTLYSLPASLVALGFVLAAGAQSADPSPEPDRGDPGEGRPFLDGPGRPGDRVGPPDWDKEDLRELIDMRLMLRISEELDLSDEQTVLMMRGLRAMREEAQELQERREELVRTLRDAVRADPDEDLIAEYLDQIVAIDEQLATQRLRRFEKAREELSPEQSARLYIIMQDFEHHVRKMIERAQQFRSEFRSRMGNRRDAFRQRFGDRPEDDHRRFDDGEPGRYGDRDRHDPAPESDSVDRGPAPEEARP